MPRRLLIASLVLVLSAPAAARAADAGYADPAVAADLAELLRADWPNQFSAEEAALPPDSPVRAALWRARVAAKALPPLPRGGEIPANAAGRLDLTVRVTRKSPGGQPIDDRILDFGPGPTVFSLRSTATATAAPYGGVWVWFAGPLGNHPPDYPQFDVWYFYVQTPSGRVHAARDMPACVWGTERSPSINCLQVGTNQIQREQDLYDSLLAQKVGDVLWNGRYCEPNYFPGSWDPPNKVKCLTRLTTHDRFVRELPSAYFLDNDGRPVNRTVNYTVPATLDVAAAVESLEAEDDPAVDEWVTERVAAKRTLIFVPGVAGSTLMHDLPAAPDVVVWPTAVLFGGAIESLAVSDDGNTSQSPVKATSVLEEAFTRDVYGTALATFSAWEAEGYIERFVPFPYDWRLGVGTAAVLLAEEILARCDDGGALWVVAHSTGGLALKAAAAFLAPEVDVARCFAQGGVVFLGTPHLGAPKAIGSVINPDRFFGSALEQRLVDEQAFARVVNDWQTVWDLMPGPGAAPTPDAREAWFDDRADGNADLNVAGEPLNGTLDARSLATRDQWYRRGVLEGVRVFNVFGLGSPTPGSYAPGRCDTNVFGVERLRDLDRNATLDREDDGDETVPGWSASWPASGIETFAQYAIWGEKHTRIPGNEHVRDLLRSIVGSTTGYPGWPFPRPTLLRGVDAVTASTAPLPGSYKTMSCSPVHMVASYGGGEIGVRPDGSIVDGVATGLVESAGPADDPQETIVITPDAVSAAPVYHLTAFLPGPVSIWHREPDGSKHDFRFTVAFGDRAILRQESSEWVLSIDRGGDGSYDERLVANHPYVAFRGGGGTIPAGTPYALQLDAQGQIAGALAFEWELIAGEGTLEAAGPNAVFVPDDGPDDVAIEVTVTDSEGATASDVIELHVENAAPVAAAGDDASVPWGMPLDFAGTATDAAPDVAAGLTLGWDFGDGSRRAGATHLHAYAEPGTYVATFTAIDRDGAAGTDSRNVTVTKRAASMSLNAAAAPFGTRSFTFAVVDEVDAGTARLAGRHLRLTLAGSSHVVPVAADGQARLDLDAPPPTGLHPVRVELLPDELYMAAAVDATLLITNGYGDVEGAARYDSDARAAFAVHSGPDRLSGQLEYRSPERIRLHSATITTFGIVDGAAWFSGVATDGRRFVARAASGSFSMWIDGRLEPNGRVEAGAIQVRPG